MRYEVNYGYMFLFLCVRFKDVDYAEDALDEIELEQKCNDDRNENDKYK